MINNKDIRNQATLIQDAMASHRASMRSLEGRLIELQKECVHPNMSGSVCPDCGFKLDDVDKG